MQQAAYLITIIVTFIIRFTHTILNLSFIEASVYSGINDFCQLFFFNYNNVIHNPIINLSKTKGQRKVPELSLSQFDGKIIGFLWGRK